MGILALLLMLPADEPVDSLSKKMLPIYVREAEDYKIAVESASDKPLALKKEPIFEWSNPTRGLGQQGSVFLWLRDGRPAALGCIFSEQDMKLPGRQIVHELHALDPEKLVVTRSGDNQWKPKTGLVRAELADAGTPATTPGLRSVQMRRLAQEFTGHSLDWGHKRWELRLLPSPLYRYPEAKTGVVDGALFALVSNAGTDPEVLLLIEARERAGKLHWEYACGRFSDWELHVQRKDKELFSSIPSETNTGAHDPNHTYQIYMDKIVTLDGKVLAWNRLTPGGSKIVPVEEK